MIFRIGSSIYESSCIYRRIKNHNANTTNNRTSFQTIQIKRTTVYIQIKSDCTTNYVKHLEHISLKFKSKCGKFLEI